MYESPESLGLPDPIGSFMLHQEDESETQEPPECEVLLLVFLLIVSCDKTRNSLLFIVSGTIEEHFH